MTATATRTFKRGEHAMTRPNGCAAPQRVVIVRAENLQVGVGAATRTERWLHVQFADGGRVLMHPTNLVECIG